MVTLVQVYNEKEQEKQAKIKNVQFEEKRSARKQNGVKASVPGDKKFTQKILVLNGIKEMVTPEKDSTQLSLQFVKRNYRRA